jgi:hypothetical protein
MNQNLAPDVAIKAQFHQMKQLVPMKHVSIPGYLKTNRFKSTQCATFSHVNDLTHPISKLVKFE